MTRRKIFEYFQEVEPDHWKCTCGKILKRKKSSGWTNLINHLNSQHSGWNKASDGRQATLETSGFSGISHSDASAATSTSILSSSTKATNICSWIEWVCVGLKPFNFVSDSLTRKYTNLEPISVNTLKKYMDLLVKRVEKKIAQTLPEKFALIIDAWTANSTHFVAVFASYPDNTSLGFSRVLLGFSPLESETEFTAEEHKTFLEWMLSNVYNKSLTNVVAIIGDNAAVNKTLADTCKTRFIGCASHRFNLAVNKLLEDWKEILDKVHSLMISLRSLKLAGALRMRTKLSPIIRNATRWSSTVSMVNRYFELKPFLADMDHPNLLDSILSPRESNTLSQLQVILKKLESVTKALQRENLDLTDVRLLFDEVIIRHPETESYLSENADIIHCKEFETAVRKILSKRESSLTDSEIESVQNLLLRPLCSYEEAESSFEDDFATAILTKKSRIAQSTYVDCRFLTPTSDIVERFFSLAGYCFNDCRRSLTPMNLEIQLFLKVNHRLWDSKAVQKVIAESDVSDSE